MLLYLRDQNDNTTVIDQEANIAYKVIVHSIFHIWPERSKCLYCHIMARQQELRDRFEEEEEENFLEVEWGQKKQAKTDVPHL